MAASQRSAKLTPGAAKPDVVGEIVLLPVADIDIGDRVRPVDIEWARALGAIIAKDGQNSEIEVCKLPGRTRWTLVAGAHRLVGHRESKLAYIRAKIVENDPVKRIEREISDEIWRRRSDPIERAAFVASQVMLLKQRAGVSAERSAQSIAANARWQQQLDAEADDATETISGAYGFAEQVGEMLGLTARTIRNDLLLQRIAPALVDRLRRGSPATLRNAAQLRSLAKLDEDQQKAAVDRLLWQEPDGEARKPMTLAEAIAAGKARVAAQPDAETKALSQFFSAFGRMTAGQKKSALAKLADMLPAGYRLTFGPQMAANGFPEGYEKYRDEAFEAIDTTRDLLDGILEDSTGAEAVHIDADRHDAIRSASTMLQMTRLAICADALPLGCGA